MGALTVTVRLFEYEELKARLKADDRIVILSCDSCAKRSGGLGGEDGLNSLADKLAADGFDVVDRGLLPTGCSAEHLNDHLDQASRQLFEEADVIIPLSCRKGIATATDALPGVKVLRVTKTLGAGTSSPEDGVRLTGALDDIEIEIDGADGVPLAEAADSLGLCPGSF